MKNFNKNILFIYLIFIGLTSYAQKITTIFQGQEKDSSFYHLANISVNEFWAGGEYGILKKIDSLGNVSSLNFNNEGLNILDIERNENYIFIATDNAVIYRYNIQNRTFSKKTFQKFDNRCFYDIETLENGKLLVCGGTTGISDGEKKIPNGFVALIDSSFEQIDIIWRNVRKFPWSILELESGEILVSTFNGLNSDVIKTSNFKKWKKEFKIKGLVHEITEINHEIYFSGTPTIHYAKNGIIGNSNTKKLNSCLNKGCVWSMEEGLNETVYGVTNNGELLNYNLKTNQIDYTKIHGAFTLYDIEKISDSKFLIVGHGKGIYLINL